MRLLTQPPPEVPDEVAESILREHDQELRSAGQIGAVIYFSCLPLALPLIAAGVLSWPSLLLSLGLLLVTAVIMFFVSRADHPPTVGVVVTIALGFACMASTSTVFGVYTVLPGFIATSAVATSQNGGRLPGWVPIGLGCLAVLVPVGLELVGVLAPSYRFSGGTIEILPRMIAFPGRATELLLLGLTLTVVVMPALYTLRQQRVLFGAQERLHMQAWQLKRLLPPAG